MPWDIWTIVVIWIIAQILQCWEKIMRMKIFCFEGCYLLTSVLKIVVLTVVFMTLAFSSVLIELILGTQFVNRQSVSQNLFCYSTVICSLSQEHTFLQCKWRCESLSQQLLNVFDHSHRGTGACLPFCSEAFWNNSSLPREKTYSLWYHSPYYNTANVLGSMPYLCPALSLPWLVCLPTHLR